MLHVKPHLNTQVASGILPMLQRPCFPTKPVIVGVAFRFIMEYNGAVCVSLDEMIMVRSQFLIVVCESHSELFLLFSFVQSSNTLLTFSDHKSNTCFSVKIQTTQKRRK